MKSKIRSGQSFSDKRVNGSDVLRCRIAKGDIVFIPILAINREKAVWGEDSMEFRRVSYLGWSLSLLMPDADLNVGRRSPMQRRVSPECGATS